MPQSDLSKYDHCYKPAGNVIKRLLWYYINLIFFKSGWFPIKRFKVFLLRLFGAQVGKRVIIKPGVNIKYAWNLKVGSHSWIGENVWIDNLALVSIGNNVCLSQGVILQTGSHNYKKETFDLITGSITIEDGVWVGGGAIINLGVTAGSHCVLASGSVANKNLETYFIYQGNPAIKLRPRIME